MFNLGPFLTQQIQPDPNGGVRNGISGMLGAGQLEQSKRQLAESTREYNRTQGFAESQDLWNRSKDIGAMMGQYNTLLSTDPEAAAEVEKQLRALGVKFDPIPITPEQYRASGLTPDRTNQFLSGQSGGPPPPMPGPASPAVAPGQTMTPEQYKAVGLTPEKTGQILSGEPLQEEEAPAAPEKATPPAGPFKARPMPPGLSKFLTAQAPAVETNPEDIKPPEEIQQQLQKPMTPDEYRALGPLTGMSPVMGRQPPSVMPGELHLNAAIAPHVRGDVRPLAPGEYIKNPDGSWSSEVSMTVTDPRLNGGKPTVVPSMWLIGGKPHLAANDGEAVSLALDSGLSFKSFGTIPEAEKFAISREAAWQKLQRPEDASSVAPLYGPLPGMSPIIGRQPSEATPAPSAPPSPASGSASVSISVKTKGHAPIPSDPAAAQAMQMQGFRAPLPAYRATWNGIDLGTFNPEEARASLADRTRQAAEGFRTSIVPEYRGLLDALFAGARNPKEVMERYKAALPEILKLLGDQAAVQAAARKAGAGPGPAETLSEYKAGIASVKDIFSEQPEFKDAKKAVVELPKAIDLLRHPTSGMDASLAVRQIMLAYNKGAFSDKDADAYMHDVSLFDRVSNMLARQEYSSIDPTMLKNIADSAEHNLELSKAQLNDVYQSLVESNTFERDTPEFRKGRRLAAKQVFGQLPFYKGSDWGEATPKEAPKGTPKPTNPQSVDEDKAALGLK